ncbi:DUF262 domain-containing protein [Dellaglioa algida]|uniref:DUF262 domain-containing protein n=1 Tax=Dellaglioa algida TaxID=105612 RepID=UPI0024DE2352|nr:DUF262 domain-containing protein [Dellaglioa algida]MDK1736623.1 DUF262 domain-containing HNH endonuclease family protein [Dellaglioa algida]
MNFDAVGDNVRGLLTATRTYVVPRFQRDFSWDESNYKELLKDLIAQIRCEQSESSANVSFQTSQYYLGNMIFLGTKDKGSVQIIDGQQRLTTGTILLAAIRDVLYESSKTKDDLAFNYAETTQNEYLVKKIDGTPQRKLQTTSSYPYFTQTIQGYNKDSAYVMQPSNEEEETLKNAFEFFKNQLKQSKFLSTLFDKSTAEKPHKPSDRSSVYVSGLKALRDQFLQSEIVAIFVADDNQAYKIFENINSKGKALSQVDLIKNDIFSKIQFSSTTGVDIPTFQWKEINRNLSDLDTDFNEFFLHFWKSKFPSDSANGGNLYKKYINKFKDDTNNTALINFTDELRSASKIYANIISPSKDDYPQQQKIPIYQSLDSINKFRGVQSRVALLSLFKSDIPITSHKKKQFLKFLANFHLAAFGTESKIPSNQTTNKYKIFSQDINSATKPEDIYTAMTKLETSLRNLISEDDFKNGFKKLSFSKQNSKNSLSDYPASYAIKSIADHMDSRDYNDDEYSIEHILDESGDHENLTNIGNLSVLETNFNSELSNLKPKSFQNNINYKQDIYKKSSYKMVKVDLSPNFNLSLIEERSSHLADYFWDNLLRIE